MTASIILNDDDMVYEPKANGQTSSKCATLHRNMHRNPTAVVGALGNYIELSNGQKILDATGGAAVSCLGHGHPRVKEAIIQQMENVSYCHSLFFGTSAGENLGRELIDSTGGQMSRAFIVSSGNVTLYCGWPEY